MGVLGSLISAGSSLLGGLMSKGVAEDQADLQKKFAKNAIQWKVQDAKKAGIHPLYALGANTVSYQPVGVGDQMPSAMADMGQDISRAVEAVQSGPERASAKILTGLQLERAQLENDYLKAQIAGQIGTNQRNAQVGPAMPAEGNPGDTLSFMGYPIPTDPRTTSMQVWENRYGDEGPIAWSMPFGVAGADIVHNMWRSLSPSMRSTLSTIDSYVRRYGPMRDYGK